MDFIKAIDPFVLVVYTSIFNWLMTLFGASLVWFVKAESEKLKCVVLGIAVGIVITSSFFSLLLPAIEMLDRHTSFLIIPLGFICGVLIFRLCNSKFPHEAVIPYQKENIHVERFAINKLLMLAMAMHNIPEGLVIGVSFAGAINGNYLAAIALAIGIGMQNFPEGSAISLPMYQYTKSKFSAMMYGQFFAIIEIPLAILGFIIASKIPPMLPFFLSLSYGAMIFICIEELIPKANCEHNLDIATISCMVGFLIVMTLDFWFS